jgi:hypothetical protein
MGLKSWVKKTVNKIVTVILNAIFKPLLKPIYKPFNFLSNLFSAIFTPIFALLDLVFDGFLMIFDMIDFLFKFFEIIIEIFSKIGYYVQNPFEFLILLIQLAIMFLNFTVSFVYHTFSIESKDRPNHSIKLVEIVIYTLLLNIYFPYILLRGLVWLVWNFIIEYLILQNIDKMTSGYVSSFIYRYFEACENPPNAWYMTPSWHKGNANEKVIFAFNKCPGGYSTNDAMGLFCKQNDKHEMIMCPHANLYRLYEGESSIGDLKPRDFDQKASEYLKLSRNAKETEQKKYRNVIETTQQSCEKSMADKSDLLKTICLQQKTKNGEKNIKMDSLCYNLYCKNSNDQLCHQFVDGNLSNNIISMPQNGVEIMLFSFILIIILILVGYKIR